MRKWIGLALLAATIGGASCRARKTTSAVDAAMNPIDKVYERYKRDRSWVDPDDDSKELREEPRSEGSFATCAHCDYEICYEDLPIEGKLRIKSDADLLRMVRWLRDTDPCVRRVAEHVLLPKLGSASGAPSLSLQDTGGFEYHSIFFALKTRLDVAKVPYDPKIFDGIVLPITERDFAELLHGTWQRARAGADELIVQIGSDSIRVTTRARQGDPKRPDTTWSNHFDEVQVNLKEQFEIAGRSPDGGIRHFLFWPVTKDVVWLVYSNQGGDIPNTSWEKMKRSR